MADESTILARFATMGAEEFIANLDRIMENMRAVGDASKVFDTALDRLKQLYQEGAVSSETYHAALTKLQTALENFGASSRSTAEELSKMQQILTETSNADKSAADFDRMTASQKKSTDAAKAQTEAYDKLLESQERVNEQLTKADVGRLAEQQQKLTAQTKAATQASLDLAKANEAEAAAKSKNDAATASLLAKQQALTSTAIGRFTTQMYGGAEALAEFEKNAYQASRNASLLAGSLAGRPIATMSAFMKSTEKAAIAAQFLREQIEFVAKSRFGTIMVGFAIFGTIASMIRQAAEATAEMDKAVSFVSSAFIDATDGIASYGQIMKQIEISSIMTGKSFKDVGQAMWELKSAGLTAAETFAFMDTNMKLATMNNTKMAEAIRLTVGLYRNFGDSITSAITPMEKMAYVGDTLAFALNKSAADMNDIMQAFKYVASTANLAGVSIEEVTAGLIVLHNHMIRGSTAGMSLNMMFVQLSKNAGKIAEAFNLKIDTTKPLDLVDILNQIDKSGVAANKSLDDLAKMFTNFEVRAARAFATLIKNPKEFLKAYDDLVKGVQSEALDKVFETMMDNLDSQWKRFKQVVAVGMVWEGIGGGLKTALKGASDLAEAFLRIGNVISIAKQNAVDFINTFALLSPILKVLTAGAEKFGGAVSQASHIFQTGFGGALVLAKYLEKAVGYTGAMNPALQSVLLTQKDVSAQVAKQLSDDEKIQVSIAKGTASLQQQLSYAQRVADAAEKAFLANMNLSEDDKERTKSWNAYLSALGKVRQVQNQIDQSVKKTITSQEKQNKAAETLASIFREIVELELTGSTKTLTSDLEAAVDKANKLKVGTKAWNSAVKEVALAYKESLKAQDGLNKQIEKAISSFDKLKGAGAAFIDVLKQAGQVGLAEQVGQYMAQQAEQQLVLARTDEQRLAALQNIVNVQKILTENEWGGADALQKQINAYAEMFNINSSLLTQETARAKQAAELRTKAQAIFEKTKEWKAPVQQFNTELTKSNQNMQEIYVWSGNAMKNIKVMADQGGVNFQGSVEQAKVLNQNLAQTETVIDSTNSALTTTNTLMQQFSANSQNLPIVWRGYSDEQKKALQLMTPMIGQVMQLDATTGKLVMTTSELPTIWQGFSEKINAPLQMMSNSIIYFDDAVSSTDTTLKEMTATIYTMAGGLVNVDTVAGTVNNRMTQWNQSISGTAQDITDMGSTVYSLANGMLSVQQSSQSIADETDKWKRKQEELNMSFQQTNDTATDMGVEIYTLTKGMLEVATATDVSNKALESVSESTGDVNQDVGKISDNFDTAQKAVVQVSNAVQRTTTPIEEIKSKTAQIQQDFVKWQSPLQTSYGTTESINSAMGNVANSVDRVLGKLDSMAQKIRSMPKLNVTGGGGGMPTNNDILTNPGYQ